MLGVGYFLDQIGWTFYGSGKEIVLTIRSMAGSVRSRDLRGIERFYSGSFRGSRLGFSCLKLKDEKDGIRRYEMVSDGDLPDRAAALNEWKEYLDTFDSIEDVQLHVHRLESWFSRKQKIASLRYELIGTLKGATHASIDRGYFRVKFEATSEGPRIREAALMEGDRITGETPHFTDVAHEAGVDFLQKFYPPFLTGMGFKMIMYGPGGISAVDYDNDGLYDLFIPDGIESRMFRNRGDGTFEDVTATTGLSGLDGVSVGVFADYDNDGYKDAFISRTFKPNQLFRNNGDGTFTDVTAKSGIGEDCCTTVASWADYDNDGLLDLYVGRYMDPRKGVPTTFYARNGEPNQLYRNNGNGTFTNVTLKAGVGDVGLCLGSVWGDYDDDGYPDLYVVNDFGRKTLYHNNRNGTFSDVSVRTHTLAYGAGMSAAMADYDNDGRLDMYVSNIRSDYAWYAEWPTVGRYMVNSYRQWVWMEDYPLYMQIFFQSGYNYVGVFKEMAYGNNLFHNEGNGKFRDVTQATGTNPPGWYWGSLFADLDNDGWKDIYACDGWVRNDKDTEIEMEFLNNVVTHQNWYKAGVLFDPKNFGRESWHGWDRNRYLRNNGDGTFTEMGRGAGVDLLLNSRGLAVADFWNRGVLDLAISACDDRHALLRNEVATKRNWFAVETVGTKSNRDGIGARITLRIGSQTQMREVLCGDSYGSQSSLRMYFGIDKANTIDELTVRWPRSGVVQTFRNVPANRIVEVAEGRDQLTEKRYPIKQGGVE